MAFIFPMNEQLRQRLMHLESDYFHPRNQKQRFNETKRAIIKAKHYKSRYHAPEVSKCLTHALTLVQLLERNENRSSIVLQEEKLDRLCRTLFILYNERR